MFVVLIFLSQLKVETEAINKIMFELLIVNGIIVAIRIFLIKNFSLQPNFETRSRLHIDLSIMGRPFSMYIIISMDTYLILQ